VINTTDLILTTTILAIGMIVGLVVLRNQVVQELGDTGTAIGNLNQSYSFTGRTIGEHSVADSSYVDEPDVGDGDDAPGEAPGGIDVAGPAPVLLNLVPGED
jgi:hypothetical protein